MIVLVCALVTHMNAQHIVRAKPLDDLLSVPL